MPKRTGLLLDAITTVSALCAVVITVQILSDHSESARIISTEGGPATEVENWTKYADGGHRFGPPDAQVTIVYWGDYQCPACQSFQPHLDAVLRKYSEDIAVIYRHWPLKMHQLAMPAATAAECAADLGSFEVFHRGLYQQSNWLGVAFDDLAREAGVQDLKTFNECLQGADTLPSIKNDIAAVLELGGRGTPTLLVNGLLLHSSPDSLALGAVVEEALR